MEELQRGIRRLKPPLDVRCARNAQRTLAERRTDIQIVSIAAAFDGRDEHGAWEMQADYVVPAPAEVLSIAREFGLER